MDGPGRQIFTGARFTGDEHGHVGFRHHLDAFEHALHPGALTDEVLKGFVLLHVLLQAQVFPEQAAAFQRLFQGEHQVVVFERLGDEVVSAAANGLHRQFDAAVGGHHDHGEPGLFAAQLLQEFEAVHARHFHVDQGQINRPLTQQLQRIAAGGGGLHPTAQITFQPAFEQLQQIDFIIDHQNGIGHDPTFRDSGCGTARSACGTINSDCCTGSTTEKVEPVPGSLATSISPLWCWTMP